MKLNVNVKLSIAIFFIWSMMQMKIYFIFHYGEDFVNMFQWWSSQFFNVLFFLYLHSYLMLLVMLLTWGLAIPECYNRVWKCFLYFSAASQFYRRTQTYSWKWFNFSVAFSLCRPIWQMKFFKPFSCFWLNWVQETMWR